MRVRRLLPVLFSLVAVVSGLAAPAAPEFDLIIRHGRVLDGSGAPWFRADIGIRDGRIVTVEPLAGRTAREEIDATDLYVAPGFIDGHSHAGPALAKASLAAAEPQLAQGVTTIFVNPDGGGPVDLRVQRTALERHGPGVNVAQMIGHNAVRLAVMEMENRAPTDAELARMTQLVRDALDAGAFGLSSGPYYTPGSYSTTDELVALARPVAEVDGFHSSHIRDEGNFGIGLRAAVDELIEVSRRSGVTGVVTHLKALGPDVWGASADIVARIDAARAAGLEIYADQYPYDAGSTSITAALVPPAAQAGGRTALLRRFDDPVEGPAIRAGMEANLAKRNGAANMQIRRFEPEPRYEGRRLADIAAEAGVSPVEMAVRMIRGGGAAVVMFAMAEEDIARFMQQPWTMTASDGSLEAPGEGVPHPRSYGTFPRKIRRHVFERGTITLEQAIHSMTGLPANAFRLRDRGRLQPGQWADIVVFDAARVRDLATYEQPQQLAEGMVHVLVNGRAAIRDGRFTGERAGRVLVRPGTPHTTP